MATPESEADVIQHLEDQAEGGANLFEAEDQFSAEGGDGLEDSFESEGEGEGEGEGESEMDGLAESEDGLEGPGEDAFEEPIAAALNAESEDQFLKGLMKTIGKVARVAAPILSVIPHPAAQVAARVAGLAGKVIPESESEGEDGVMQQAAEAAAEATVRDIRARPVVVGLVSRQIAQNRAAGAPLAHRRAIVRQVNQTARILTRRAGPNAIRALPKIAASVNRTANVRGTSLAGRLAVLRRTTQRLMQRPDLLRRLSKPTARGQRLGRWALGRRRGGQYGAAPGLGGYDPSYGSGNYGGGNGNYGGSYGGTDPSGSGTRRIVMDVPCEIIIRRM
jgi:hypothetical protein